MRTLLLVAAALLALSSSASAECDHAYFPAKVGTTHTYQRGETRHTSTITAVKGSTVTMEMEATREGSAEPVKVTATGECTGEGVRVNLGSLSGVDAKMSTKSQTGYTFPPASKLKVGATWNETKVMSMSAASEKGSMAMDMEVKSTYKVEASEKVKVPAGEFTALKIRQDNETLMKMEGPMAAMMPKEPQKSVGYTWIVKNVGVVKTQNDFKNPRTGESRTDTSELVSYKVK